MKNFLNRLSDLFAVKTIASFAALFLIAGSLTIFLNTSDQQPENKVGDKTDRPDLARKQDAMRTMDPTLGYVPSERLSHVFNIINQQQSQKGGNPDPLSTASWVERGPSNIGGRTRALMFDPNDGTKKKVWAGGVGGGLWKTNDITVASPVWVNVNSFWANIAVSCIAYAPSSLNTFYVGTGEGWYNVDAIRGNGIWKTTDGGATWNQLASTTGSVFYNVQKIVVTSNGYVYAATRSGGVRRSTDGGTTWAQVLAGAAADLEVGADGTLFATIGIFNTGGIYSSSDGLTWTNRYTSGTGEQRIEIACAPSDANRLYAMVQDNTYALKKIMKSTDKGANWSSVTLPTWCDQGSSDPDMTRGQAWYDLIAAVDPNNANTLFTGGVDVMKSTDAGSTWAQVSRWSAFGGCSGVSMHADQHAIVFAPGSSSIIAFGNDGGVYYTTDGLATVASKNTGYNVTQFYSCAIHPTASQNYFLAGAQDNGTQKFSSAGMNSTTQASGGDGAFCFIDQDNPTYQISAYVNNNFYRSTNGGVSFSSMTSDPNGSFINPADYDDVNNILYSGYNSNTLYRVTAVTGTPAAGTISISAMTGNATHIKVSPNTPTTLFVGCADGKVIKVTGANGTPSSVSISTGLPAGSISCVEVGATDNDLLVTYSNYGVTSVWTSSNGGTSWTSREGNLPDMPVRWALRNPNDSKEVLLATEVGIWSTTDVTASFPSWVVNNTGLANVRVDMLQLRNSDKEVIAATHGRGLFSSNVFAASSIPPTKLLAEYCGITVTSLSQLVYCNDVPGAQYYGFEVTHATTSFTATYTQPTGTRAFALSSIPGVGPGKTYVVRARAYKNGVWGNYWAPCNLTTPNTTPVTKLMAAYCGITVSSIPQTVYCDYVAGATQYGYLVTHTASSFTVAYTQANGTRAFSLGSIPGIKYGLTYVVQVRAYVNGVWGNYWAPCNLTTPAITPVTKLMAAYCGVTVSSSSQMVYCDYVATATSYQYLVTHAASSYSVTYTDPNATRSFALSFVAGIQSGKTYTVQVRAYVNGVWGNYWAPCTITVGGAIINPDEGGSLRDGIDQVGMVAVFPNPVKDGELNLMLNDPAVSGEMLLEISNIIGEEMFASKVMYSAGDVIKLPLNEKFVSGTYFMTITVNNNQVYQKFVVQR